MIAYSFLTLLTVLFALNMGGGNFAASFAAAHGSKILSIRKAQVLFVIFVELEIAQESEIICEWHIFVKLLSN